MTAQRTAAQGLEPTPDPAWILDQQGFDPLRDSSRESRFAISNGFLGIRGGRTIDRLPGTAIAPRTYVAGLFDSLHEIRIDPGKLIVEATLESGEAMDVFVGGKPNTLSGSARLSIPIAILDEQTRKAVSVAS